jgi:hypothetical protein
MRCFAFDFVDVGHKRRPNSCILQLAGSICTAHAMQSFNDCMSATVQCWELAVGQACLNIAASLCYFSARMVLSQRKKRQPVHLGRLAQHEVVSGLRHCLVTVSYVNVTRSKVKPSKPQPALTPASTPESVHAIKSTRQT